MPLSDCKTIATGPINYNLFKGTIRYSYCIASTDWMIVGNELERMWKEAVVVQFRALSRHFHEETEENHENL
jgi:hypothetical protein